MHHKAVLLRENCIVVVGGRRSPFKPSGSLFMLNIAANLGEWKLIEPHKSAQIEPRWRHSATRCKLDGKLIASRSMMTCIGLHIVQWLQLFLVFIDSWCVIIFGGLSSSNEPMNNGYIIDSSPNELRIEKVKFEGLN